MTAGRCTHSLDIQDDVVIEHYTSWGRGEPRREWAALVLLAEHAPGLAPAPVEAALEMRPPMIVMSRLPGSVLRGRHATGEQITAMARRPEPAGALRRTTSDSGQTGVRYVPGTRGCAFPDHW